MSPLVFRWGLEDAPEHRQECGIEVECRALCYLCWAGDTSPLAKHASELAEGGRDAKGRIGVAAPRASMEQRTIPIRAANSAVGSQPLGFGKGACKGRRGCEPALEVGRPSSDIASSRSHTVPFQRVSLARCMVEEDVEGEQPFRLRPCPLEAGSEAPGDWGVVAGRCASGSSRALLRRGRAAQDRDAWHRREPSFVARMTRRPPKQTV